MILWENYILKMQLIPTHSTTSAVHLDFMETSKGLTALQGTFVSQSFTVHFSMGKTMKSRSSFIVSWYTIDAGIAITSSSVRTIGASGGAT